MGQRAEQLKRTVVDKACSLARQRMSPEKAASAERFIRHFYAHAAPADIARESADQVYGAAVAFLQFGSRRIPGKSLVRVYSPRIELHGWQSAHTVVECITGNRSFLVDSVTSELNKQGLNVHLVIHPVFVVRRDQDGLLLDVRSPDEADEGWAEESFIHAEVDRESAPERLDEMRTGLEKVLDDVRRATEDWQAMRSTVHQVARHLDRPLTTVDAAEAHETAAFLWWLDNDHFTFLGYRAYKFTDPEWPSGPAETLITGIVPGSGLGILRDESVSLFDGLRALDALPPDVQDYVRKADLVRVTKANMRSTVHRPVHLDTIFVKWLDDQDMIVGEHLFVGLFTSVAYYRMVREVPFLRKKVDRILDRAGFDPRGHDGKRLLHILGTLPRDELFQASEDDLYDISLGVLHLQERQRVALFTRRDPFERFISALVYTPRDRFDTALRQRFRSILEDAFSGVITAYYTNISESPLARVHFIIKTPAGDIPEVNVADVEDQLVEAARAWTDHLRSALVDAEGEEAGLRLFARYSQAFGPAYTDRVGTDTAVFDIKKIEGVYRSGALAVDLYQPLEADPYEIHLKLYHLGAPLPLSDILPILENMDLQVITEMPFEVHPEGEDKPVWIHDFETATVTRAGVNCVAIKDKFQEALLKVWAGAQENDGFNRLVMRNGLTWREVTVLRAQARYLRQAGVQFSVSYMSEILADHGRIARRLIALFQGRFDPARQDADNPDPQDTLVQDIRADIDKVKSLDADRMLRRFLNLNCATLRTNYFQSGPDGQCHAYLSMKLDSQHIDDLPLPRPMVEVFVYSPAVEAIHLRGGKVARGGIRWSDRREDFRTEVLGLMKAQMVKNAVIVPVGSKGGFVVRRPPPAEAGRDAQLREGVACYQTMMRGLFDLTDNLDADGHVIRPEGVVRYDGDDPYLVVAADKGTATFSDIANGVSQEYGFWLDDAFASGGSVGYDHKKMGITARGAWESVKRHFREMGRDSQSQDFTCVGIGDMSGDVFGNGMLLSRHLCLVGAFNHLHIFCDPNPDPETSYSERKRLFDLGRSSWTDYDMSKLSEGGAIFERNAKSVELSPQIRARFGIEWESVTPAELIAAMLKAEIDLLFFGGIGTFVKAVDESQAEVGDKANDPIRVNGRDLRCRVVGEGANLGMTQRGRIEAALVAGVRLNTDAIDNSAGVDCSDHEVNLKIMLGDLVSRGDLTTRQRNELLEAMTEDVADLVLRDNYLQTQVISLAELEAVKRLDRHQRFMRALEKSGRLNRAVELLPTDETLEDRAKAQHGLSRPELAVLVGYAKLVLYDELLASDLPDDPFLVDTLHRYFPDRLVTHYRPAVERHRLRREIIANQVTNDVINRTGPAFVLEQVARSGRAVADVARAYVVVREVFQLRDLWKQIEALDLQAPAATQLAMVQETTRLIERTAGWFLGQASEALSLEVTIAQFTPSIAEVAETLQTVLGVDARTVCDDRMQRFMAERVPEALARHIAGLPFLSQAVDVVQIATERGLPVLVVAPVYYSLGQRLGFEWLREQAARVKAETTWQEQAVSAIVEDLFAHQTELTRRILADAEQPVQTEDAIDAWLARCKAAVGHVSQLLTDLRAAPAVDIAMLAVANRQLRGLFAG